MLNEGVNVPEANVAVILSGSGSVREDGNGVDVDREMAALTENNLEYQAIAGVLRQRFRTLETVIGNR